MTEIKCRALGHDVTFDGETWTGSDELLVETLNALTEPRLRHSPSDPAELGAVRQALAAVDGEIVEGVGPDLDPDVVY